MSRRRSTFTLAGTVAASGLLGGCQLAFPTSEASGDAASTAHEAGPGGGRDAQLDARGDGTGDATGDAGADAAADGSAEAQAACNPSGHPATDSLTDPFTSGLPSTAWFSPSGGCVSEADGGVFTTVTGAAGSQYCLFLTSDSYHLLCSSVTVKVAEVARQVVGVQTFIDIGTKTGGIDLLLEAGGFSFLQGTAGTPLSSYDAAKDVWWRLRESGGTLFFETSADGAAWTMKGQTADPPGLDAVQVTIGAGAYRATSMPGTAEFRCYNLPAGCE